MNASNAYTPVPSRIPVRTWKIAAVTGAGAFMAMLDSTVVNLAVETIRSEFSSTLATVQWIATGYLVALAVSLPAAGWLGARYGQGRVWASSLTAFVCASVLCGLAPGPPSLIAARLLQGLAGGLMIPTGQAIVASAAGAGQLGRIMGTLGLVVALGPAIGPAVGGILLETASWRWLFWINLPIGAAALLAARGIVPAGPCRADRKPDWRGLILLGLGLPLLLYGATQADPAGLAGAGGAALALGALLTAGFVLRALRIRHPLIELRLLGRRTFAAATAVTGLTGANMYGGLLLLPLYFQLAGGRNVVDTGLMLFAMGLGSAAALPFGGALTDRFGAGPVVLAGAGLLVATSLPFLLPEVPSTTLLATVLAIRGAALALAQMPAMTSAYVSVSKDETGDAATLVNIVQRIAGAVGAAGVAALFAHPPPANDAGMPAAGFAALVVLSALTVVPAAILCHRPGDGRIDGHHDAGGRPP